MDHTKSLKATWLHTKTECLLHIGDCTLVFDLNYPTVSFVNLLLYDYNSYTQTHVFLITSL